MGDFFDLDILIKNCIAEEETANCTKECRSQSWPAIYFSIREKNVQ